MVQNFMDTQLLKKMETFLDEWLEKSYGYFVVSVENRPTGLNRDS